MKRLIKSIAVFAAMLLMTTLVQLSCVKADTITTVVMTYEDKVYTKQLYGVDVDKIKQGVVTDGLKSVGDLCDNLQFVTNGAVKVDKDVVMKTVSDAISAGSEGTNINIDLTKYTEEALAAANNALAAAGSTLSETNLAQAASNALNNINLVAPIASDPLINTALMAVGIDSKLSEASTKFRASEDRATNVRNAASKLNGTIVLPGQLFSCNNAFGARTVENGYGLGNVISGDTYVKGVGGGICQVSSTLNLAVLRAGIIPTQRHNHSHRSSYIGSGLDATISGSSLDYQFVNTLNYPIYISAVTDGGVLTVSIYGNSMALGGVTYEPKVVGGNMSNTTYLVGTLGGTEVSKRVCYSSRYKQ